MDINQDQWVATRKYVTYDRNYHNSGETSPLAGLSMSRDGKISVRNSSGNNATLTKTASLTARRRVVTSDDSQTNVLSMHEQHSQSQQSDSDDSQNETIPFIHSSNNKTAVSFVILFIFVEIVSFFCLLIVVC